MLLHPLFPPQPFTLPLPLPRQGGLGLPDRDYYTDADKADKRAKYVEYVATLFRLLGEAGPAAGGAVAAVAAAYADPAACASAAAAVLALEECLAEAQLTRTESRDPVRTYNKMSVEALAAAASVPAGAGGTSTGAWDWFRYFALAGKEAAALGDVNVSAPAAAARAHDVLDGRSGGDGGAASLSHYLVFHVLNTAAPFLPAAFVDAHFAFHEKELKGGSCVTLLCTVPSHPPSHPVVCFFAGTAELRPRWKRALEALEDALGEALSLLYVQKHFSGDAKPRALKIVEQVCHGAARCCTVADPDGAHRGLA